MCLLLLLLVYSGAGPKPDLIGMVATGMASGIRYRFICSPSMSISVTFNVTCLTVASLRNHASNAGQYIVDHFTRKCTVNWEVVTGMASGIKYPFICSPSMYHSCNIACWHSSQWAWGQDQHEVGGWVVPPGAPHVIQNRWLFWCQLTWVVLVRCVAQR